MKTLPRYSRAWQRFFTQEPKFSVLIAILSIVVLSVTVYCMRMPEHSAWFCTLSEISLSAVKKVILQNHGV